jgi:hypothetical protein
MPTNITHNNANYKDEETSYLAEPEGHTFSNQTITSEQVSPSNTYPSEYHRKLLNRLLFLSQMDKILRFVDERIAEHEKKMGRHLMQVEHKFDGKFMSIYEDIIDIKRAIGNDPGLSKMEDSLRDVQRELQVCDTITLKIHICCYILIIFILWDRRRDPYFGANCNQPQRIHTSR